MQLYFSPFACSMASRIAFHEAGASVEFIAVDPKTRRTADGRDFHTVNPLGLVPVLRTDEGELLFENTAILQYIADHFPSSGLAPRDGIARSYLQQWLGFVGSDLHKVMFAPLLDAKMPAAGKERALEKGHARLAYLNGHLAGREFLLDRFSVADAYLFAVLNWQTYTPVDLAAWPAVHAYYERLKTRPSVARALSEERAAAHQKAA